MATDISKPVLDYLTLLVAYITALWASWQFLATRSRELAWKRTEFLLQQGRILDSDPVLVEVSMILERRHPSLTVEHIYGKRRPIPKKKLAKYRQEFDAFLNVYERIAYSIFKARTLSLQEVNFLGSFLLQIADYPPLVEYCLNNGFREVILLSKRLYGVPEGLTEAEIDAA